QQAVATQAYVVSLTSGQRKTAHHSAEEYVQARITTPAKAAYTSARVAPASEQLIKAAVRLADLLNAGAWKGAATLWHRPPRRPASESGRLLSRPGAPRTGDPAPEGP